MGRAVTSQTQSGKPVVSVVVVLILAPVFLHPETHSGNIKRGEEAKDQEPGPFLEGIRPTENILKWICANFEALSQQYELNILLNKYSTVVITIF